MKGFFSFKTLLHLNENKPFDLIEYNMKYDKSSSIFLILFSFYLFFLYEINNLNLRHGIYISHLEIKG